MASEKPKGKVRGMPIDLPGWWLEMAQQLASKSQGWTQERLADRLSALVRRRRKWDRTVVKNFLKGRNCTAEMTEAFCLLFEGLPYPQVVARSIAEAVQLHIVRRRFDDDPDTRKMTAMADNVRDQHERLVEEQAREIASADGGTDDLANRRRAERVDRGRRAATQRRS
jgi:hypothetical protein